MTIFAKIDNISPRNKQLRYIYTSKSQVSDIFIFNKYSKLTWHFHSTLALPLNKVSEHLVESTHRMSGLKNPWFFVKLKK